MTADWRYGKGDRRGENNIWRGGIAPKGDWFNENGSRFTPTGVCWSRKDIEKHERQDREDRA